MLVGGALTLAATHPAAAQSAEVLGTNNPDALDNQYTVVFNEQGTTPSGDIESAAANLATEHHGSVNHVYTSALHGFSAELTEQAASEIAALPEVDFVETVSEVSALNVTQTDTPNWGIDRIDQPSLPLDDSYTYPTSAGAGVTVYVMDTGIRDTHHEFGDRASSGLNFTDDGQDSGDCQGHGTHVAGSVGGAGYGVAKEAELVSLKVLGCSGTGTTDGIIAAIDHVTENATSPSVVNMSLGGASSGDDHAYEAAIQASIDSGVTYVVAAGNDNADACDYRPARFDDVITVGNSDSSDQRFVQDAADGSNFGSCVDIFAPGTDILSASHTSDTEVRAGTGTSMAAPHVAGVAALYLSDNPNASHADLKTAVLDHAVSGALTNVGEDSPNLLLNSEFLIGSGS